MQLKLSEDKLREMSYPKIFSRGVNYFKSDLVNNPVKLGNTLMADVEGSSFPYYEVEIDIEHPEQYYCSCPYDYGGICKHIVALGLKWLNNPATFTEIDDLEQYDRTLYEYINMFSGLDSMDLTYILNSLANKDKSIILDIIDYREQFNKMNTQLYNYKADVLKELIVSDMNKYIEQGIVDYPADDFYNNIYELIHLLKNRAIIKRLRIDIIEEFLDLIADSNLEIDLMQKIINSAAQDQTEIEYVIKSLQNIKDKSFDSFIKSLKEKSN